MFEHISSPNGGYWKQFTSIWNLTNSISDCSLKCVLFLTIFNGQNLIFGFVDFYRRSDDGLYGPETGTRAAKPVLRRLWRGIRRSNRSIFSTNSSSRPAFGKSFGI